MNTDRGYFPYTRKPSLEALDKPLYDSAPITGSMIYLFDNPIGTQGKMYQHSNVLIPNTLPDHHQFVATALRIDVTGSDAFRRKFAMQGYLEFVIDNMIKLTLGPLGFFMPGERFKFHRCNENGYVLNTQLHIKPQTYFSVRLGNTIEAPKTRVYCHMVGVYLRNEQ